MRPRGSCSVLLAALMFVGGVRAEQRQNSRWCYVGSSTGDALLQRCRPAAAGCLVVGRREHGQVKFDCDYTRRCPPYTRQRDGQLRRAAISDEIEGEEELWCCSSNSEDACNAPAKLQQQQHEQQQQMRRRRVERDVEADCRKKKKSISEDQVWYFGWLGALVALIVSCLCVAVIVFLYNFKEKRTRRLKIEQLDVEISKLKEETDNVTLQLRAVAAERRQICHANQQLEAGLPDLRHIQREIDEFTGLLKLTQLRRDKKGRWKRGRWHQRGGRTKRGKQEAAAKTERPPEQTAEAAVDDGLYEDPNL